MAEEKEVSAENAQAAPQESSEQFIENESAANSNSDHLARMMKQFPNAVDEDMVKSTSKKEESTVVESKVEEQAPVAEVKTESKKEEVKAEDEGDIFGITKETAISKEFEGLEEFMGVIKKDHSIDDPSTLLNSISKWRKGSQKANELEEKYDSLWSDLNALPQDMKSAINAYASGEDYKKAFQSSATLLSYDREFAAQDKNELVKTYFGDKVTKLNDKLSEGDIDEDDFNDRVNDLHELSERLYNSDKSQYEKQRADSQRKQEESIEALKTSAISSVDNLKKTFPNFSDNELKKVRQRLVSQDLSSIFFTNDGKYKADAAEKIAMALYGNKVVDKLAQRAAKEAESKTTQKFVERGNTEIKANKTVGTPTSDGLKDEITKKYGSLFGGDVYS